MSHHLVVRVVSKLLMPFIFLFGLYVQFHGDFGPGGGFQAGVIFAAGFVLYALVFGVDNARRVFPARAILFGMVSGMLLFGLTGVAGMFLGGNYLGYSVLGGTPQGGQHLGIFLIELGVGITVCSVMVAIFFSFADRIGALARREE